jgi:hypothetical protein
MTLIKPKGLVIKEKLLKIIRGTNDDRRVYHFRKLSS